MLYVFQTSHIFVLSSGYFFNKILTNIKYIKHKENNKAIP